MSENGQPNTPDTLQDPTVDRTLLLARVGEAQMRLEAMASAYEQALAENVELRGRLAVMEAQQHGKAVGETDGSEPVSDRSRTG